MISLVSKITKGPNLSQCFMILTILFFLAKFDCKQKSFLSVDIDFWAVLKAQGFGYIKWAFKKKYPIVRTYSKEET